MIELENVTVKYSKNQLRNSLENVSFQADNEKIVFVGPNGSGKTTILKTILGLVQITGGVVKVYGKNVNEISNELSVSTNLPETYRLVGGTVRDIVNIYAELRGGKPEEALALIESFNLTETLSSKLFQLSSGQQKMVCNILALCFSPRIILLDEPFDNVDQAGRLKLLLLIEKSQAEMMINTHEFDLLNRLKDWSMYFIIEGRLFGKFLCSQLKDLYLNKGEVESNIAIVETSFGNFSITQGTGAVPIASARNLNSLFDEVF